MRDLQSGDILICKNPVHVFATSNADMIARIERGECITFLRYSDYNSTLRRWIEILTSDNSVGDVDIGYFESLPI